MCAYYHIRHHPVALAARAMAPSPFSFSGFSPVAVVAGAPWPWGAWATTTTRLVRAARTGAARRADTAGREAVHLLVDSMVVEMCGCVCVRVCAGG